MFNIKKFIKPKLTNQERLQTLLDQDWSYLFKEKEFDCPNHYVYIHSNPENKEIIKCCYKNTILEIPIPFYIGKGYDTRAYSTFRTGRHFRCLNELLKSENDMDDIVTIVREKMTDIEASELESKLISFFGIIADGDARLKYSQYGILYNRRYESTPLDLPEVINIKQKIKGKAKAFKIGDMRLDLILK